MKRIIDDIQFDRMCRTSILIVVVCTRSTSAIVKVDNRGGGGGGGDEVERVRFHTRPSICPLLLSLASLMLSIGRSVCLQSYTDRIYRLLLF